MKTLAERLYWLLDDRKTNQREFGLRAGLSAGFFSAAVRRTTTEDGAGIGSREAVAISDTWGVPLDWLLKGEGPVYRLQGAEIQGWPAALAVAQPQRRYGEEIWEATRRVAMEHTRGIIEADDVVFIADVIARITDPTRPERQLLSLLRAKVDASNAAAVRASAKRGGRRRKKSAPEA